MSHASAGEASSKAGGLKSSNSRSTRRNLHNRPSRPLEIAVTAPVIVRPDVEQLRRARTEFFEKPHTQPGNNSDGEMAGILDLRSRQPGPREESKRSFSSTGQGSQRRQQGRHRHRRKVDDDEEDFNIVSVCKHPGDGRKSKANVRSQDRLSTITASTSRRSHSTRSKHQRPETRGLFRRRTTSVVDMVSRPLVDIAEGGREASGSYERLMRRPTTRKRHSERGTDLTERTRFTRYTRLIARGRKIVTVTGALRCTKDRHRQVALRFKEAPQPCGRRGTLFPGHMLRHLRSATKPRM